MNYKEIIEGLLRVHALNMRNFRQADDGDCPECRPTLGTSTCDRCGRDVLQPHEGACPAIPPELRWTTREP